MTTCSTNPDLWFSDRPADIETAKEGCQGCPFKVWAACRQEGWNHEFGVYGGLSHQDREAIDPERYEALVDSNRAASSALDIQLRAVSSLMALSGRLDEGQSEAALSILSAPISTKDKSLRLTRMGLTARQVGEILGVAMSTVYTWTYRHRRAETANL